MHPLNHRIRDFYDQSTGLWLKTWGEHMHHGYYGMDGKQRKGRRQAQLDLMEALLTWGGVAAARRILDAGCGAGGSARWLASRFGAAVLGVTLSPVQVAAAEALAEEAGLSGRVRFAVQDMMTLGDEQGSFDLVWSLESAEHLPDKAALMHLFHRRLDRGGRLLMATWCHRNTPPDLSKTDERLLGKLRRVYHLPPLVSERELAAAAEVAGFKDVVTDDWSTAVAPFWGEVIRSAFEWPTLRHLLRANAATLRGAWAMRYMRGGYRRGLIRFVVLRAEKP